MVKINVARLIQANQGAGEFLAPESAWGGCSRISLGVNLIIDLFTVVLMKVCIRRRLVLTNVWIRSRSCRDQSLVLTKVWIRPKMC